MMKILISNFFLDKVKNFSNATLLFLQFLSIYLQYIVGDKFERIGPTLVFSFMLIGRLVIFYQVYRKEKQKEDAAAAQANGGLKQD